MVSVIDILCHESYRFVHPACKAVMHKERQVERQLNDCRIALGQGFLLFLALTCSIGTLFYMNIYYVPRCFHCIVLPCIII